MSGSPFERRAEHTEHTVAETRVLPRHGAIRADATKELFRVAFAGMDKLDPSDVDDIVLAVVGHLRQLRPEQFGCLSRLPDPTETIRDPRKV